MGESQIDFLAIRSDDSFGSRMFVGTILDQFSHFTDVVSESHKKSRPTAKTRRISNQTCMPRSLSLSLPNVKKKKPNIKNSSRSSRRHSPAPGDNFWVGQGQGNCAGNTHLVDGEIRIGRDDRARREVHTLSHQVTTHTTLMIQRFSHTHIHTHTERGREKKRGKDRGRESEHNRIRSLSQQII